VRKGGDTRGSRLDRRWLGEEVSKERIGDGEKGGRWEEGRTTTVESHSSSAEQVLIREPLTFHQLLCHSVARRKEYCSGDALGKEWPRGKLQLIPREGVSGQLQSRKVLMTTSCAPS